MMELDNPKNLEQVIELVEKLSHEDRSRLVDEITRLNSIDDVRISKDKVKRILQTIKPYFKKRLGKNTHKKTSDDWSFYGLASTRPDVVYVFGINVGFFKRDNAEAYNNLGMNVLVRTNGQKSEVRTQYLEFFRKNLGTWVNMPESIYTSERGGVGIEFSRYKHLHDLTDENEMIDFLKECIDSLHGIYPAIIENPDNLFDNVVLAAPQWELGVIDFCESHIE